MGAVEVSNKIELICIGCPLGCNLTVDMDGSEVVEVKGNTCKKGKEYVNQELTNPKRNISSSVKVINGDLEIVSVRLNGSIPKDKIFEVMNEIKNITVDAPIKIGDIVKHNILNLNVDLIATKNIDVLS